jgi:hypothetical protein
LIKRDKFSRHLLHDERVLWELDKCLREGVISTLVDMVEHLRCFAQFLRPIVELIVSMECVELSDAIFEEYPFLSRWKV